MTFSQIQTEVAERLNLTSSVALARIGRSINERYKRLASSIGFSTIQQTTATAATVVGNRYLTFGPSPTGVEKLLSVYNAANTPPDVLDEVSFDELRNSTVGTDPAREYAVTLMGSSSVTIFLDVIPGSIYTLTADVLSNLATLSGSQVPAFAEDYHDILIYGAMATELKKMEKDALSKQNEEDYQARISDLRMYIAKSAYLKIVQGKTSPENVLRSTPLV